MGKEAEKEINFGCLRFIVDEAIKDKDTSAIEAMDGEKQEKELRYMQKYAELKVSKDELSIGLYGIVLAILAIGLSYFLAGLSAYISMSPMLGSMYILLGVLITFISVLLYYLWIRKYQPEIKFIHEIILKIEEKASSKV